MSVPTLLFLLTPADAPYAAKLKQFIGGATAYVIAENVSTLVQVELYCKRKGVTGVLSTNTNILSKLAGRDKVSLDNYAGSYFANNGLEYVFIPPLEQLVSVPHGPHLARRYISKLANPESWKKKVVPQFFWELATPDKFERVFTLYQKAYAIAVDIETYKNNLAIRCVGYTALYIESGVMKSHSFVIPCDSMYNLTWIRKFNALPAQKIFQNGKYDCAYLSRYNAVPDNYLWDTATLMHCINSELPKDLGFLNAYYIREGRYWKDLAESSDLNTYYLYNAKDTWATAVVWLSMMEEIEQYAKDNYLQEFPLIFPCHLSEMTGLKLDKTAQQKARQEQDQIINSYQKSLDTMLGMKGGSFNVLSPPQMKALLKLLGCGDLPSTDKQDLAKARHRHPLNARIINTVIKIRKARKLVSTYLVEGKDLYGRILYALNPHGTDTGRLASKEHHFWCGLQVQNIPQGPIVKQTLIADNDFLIAECDLEQAESRDTGYISGDEVLINNVENSPDFHSANASMFFGVPFEQIYDIEAGKVINKPLRTLAKPVNHGANYNMGASVLVDSMGEEKVEEARQLLKLNRFWTYKEIAEHLLEQFHKVYKKIRGLYYPGVISEVETTGRLTSKATHDAPYQATTAGWTRICFGNPRKNKSDLNAYVAHPPQSLNAMTLNKAFMRVFYDIAIHPEHRHNFKLCAQIHDSILFQFRKGHEYLADMVRERMEIPVTVTGYDGITRKFVVPAAIKAGADGKGAINWALTE